VGVVIQSGPRGSSICLRADWLLLDRPLWLVLALRTPHAWPPVRSFAGVCTQPSSLTSRTPITMATTTASTPDLPICRGGSGTLLPLFNAYGEGEWSTGLQVVLYLVGLLWLFLGVGVAADVFMEAIEVITSKDKVITINGRKVVVRVRDVPLPKTHTRTFTHYHERITTNALPRTHYH